MTVPFVRAEGEPYEIGYRHGNARAAALRAFLADDLARVNRLAPSPVSLESLRPVLADYDAEIARAAPALSLELDGLADGAGLSRAEAVLLQARREIIGYQRIPVRGDCTTYASLSRGPDGEPVLAQTVDLNGNLDDQIAVLDVGLSATGPSQGGGSSATSSPAADSSRTDSSAVGSSAAGSSRAGRRALVLSFGGLLGYLGINSDGLAIGLNLVLGGQWRPGLPPYLAIRHLLDQASGVDDALSILRTLPLASSRSLMLLDRRRAACVEILGDELRILSGDELLHTNHFLHPDFVPADQLNVFARNSSLQRLKAATAGLAELGPADDAEGHFELLCQQPIRVADTGDIRRERTVAAVVMLPGRGELHLRPGDPLASSTEKFCLPVRALP